MPDAHLTDPVAVGVSKAARHFGVWFIGVLNVPQAASLNDGEAIVEENPGGVELFYAKQHGSPTFRSQMDFHGETF
jgi:hypothetical protein